MPLIDQIIQTNYHLAIWEIEEDEAYFSNATGLSSTIKSDKRRMEYLAGRYLLHTLLPELDLHSIKISEIGKPYFDNSCIHFSISHSYPFVAVIVHKNASVGIDIQVFREKILNLRTKFLHSEEENLLPIDIPNSTLLWNAKEALFKWKGTGGQDFSEQLRIISVEILEHQRFLLQCLVINEEGTNEPVSLEGYYNDRFGVMWTK